MNPKFSLGQIVYVFKTRSGKEIKNPIPARIVAIFRSEHGLFYDTDIDCFVKESILREPTNEEILSALWLSFAHNEKKTPLVS